MEEVARAEYKVPVSASSSDEEGESDERRGDSVYVPWEACWFAICARLLGGARRAAPVGQMWTLDDCERAFFFV